MAQANQSLLDDTRSAAAMIGIDPERLSLAQVHFHALRVADPADPDRVFHVSSLLAAANTTADFLVPSPDADDGGPESPEVTHPDLPPAPLSEEPQTPEERKLWGKAYLEKLLWR